MCVHGEHVGSERFGQSDAQAQDPQIAVGAVESEHDSAHARLGVGGDDGEGPGSSVGDIAREAAHSQPGEPAAAPGADHHQAGVDAIGFFE